MTNDHACIMTNSELIGWESSQSHVLINPAMPLKDQNSILTALKSIESLPGHIWLSTSGSSGRLKFVALSKKAILTSASAVNRHLECTQSDIWINPLPSFHIGGLATQARAYLGNYKIVDFQLGHARWNPFQFVEQMIKVKATLTALVPAHLFDFVKEGITAPEHLRAAVIGGGGVSKMLYEQAVNLGWNILPSYGSTECASQIATAAIDSWKEGCFPLLRPLEHLKLAVDQNNILKVFGNSLMTCHAYFDGTNCRLEDPKVNGWFITEDRAILVGECVESISRAGHYVKIGGESVDLLRLDLILEEIKLSLPDYKNSDMSLFAVPDDRLGHVIHLAIVAAHGTDITQFLEQFNHRVHPYERIRQVHYVDHLPKTYLQKIIRANLLN